MSAQTPGIIRLPAGGASALWLDLNQRRAELVTKIGDGSASMAHICACADAWRAFLRAFTGEDPA
jgi:hypothetical protein